MDNFLAHVKAVTEQSNTYEAKMKIYKDIILGAASYGNDSIELEIKSFDIVQDLRNMGFSVEQLDWSNWINYKVSW